MFVLDSSLLRADCSLISFYLFHYCVDDLIANPQQCLARSSASDDGSSSSASMSPTDKIQRTKVQTLMQDTRSTDMRKDEHIFHHYSEVHTLDLIDGDYEILLQNLYGTGGISFVLKSEQYVQENHAYLLDPVVSRWCSYYTRAVKEFHNVTTKEAPKDAWWIWGNAKNYGLGKLVFFLKIYFVFPIIIFSIFSP